MKTTAVLLLAAVLTALLPLPAASQDPLWQVQRITNTSWAEYAPKIWGDTVYYSSRQNGYGEIYAWSEAQGSRKLIGSGDGIHRYVSDVYEDKLLIGHYTDNPTNGQTDLYLWDSINGERLIGTGTSDLFDAKMFGDTVVWVKQGRIWAWDPVNGSRILYNEGSTQYQPRIWGDRIIWRTMNNNYPNYDDGGIFIWTPGSEPTTIPGSWSYSYIDIYEDKVVMWRSAFWVYPGGQPGIYFPGSLSMWTPTGSQTIEHDLSSLDVQIWGDLVVSSTATWDPARGFTYYSEQGHYVDSFSVYGNKVVWAADGAEGRGDIYLSTMTPEPSSMLALSGGLIALVAFRRRRQR